MISHWSFYCTVLVYVVLHFCDSMCMNFFSGNESVQIIIGCLSVLPLEIKLSRKDRFGFPLTCLTSQHLCTCPRPCPGFPTPYDIIFVYVKWIEIRGHCLFCYWWNCWPSLFKLSFHNSLWSRPRWPFPVKMWWSIYEIRQCRLSTKYSNYILENCHFSVNLETRKKRRLTILVHNKW